MSLESNKATVRRYFEGDRDGRDNTEVWDEICSPEMTIVAPMFPGPVQGLAAVKGITIPMHAAFTGLGFTVDELVAEGDTVAAAWTMSGQHTGTLQMPGMTLPATNNTVRFTGTSLCTVTDGKLAEERVQADWVGFMNQLGVSPAG
jgi:predicted ester cyclase